MKGKWILAGSLLACVLSGCATASLSTRGRNVQAIASAPGPECENLGIIFGQGGGTFGGAYISNDQLMEYAMNDAMNKAAERGATHLQVTPPQLGGTQGTTTTATVSAIAFRCPNSGANAAAAPAQAPAAPSFLDNCPQKEGESSRARAIRCKAEAASPPAKE
uniref:Membrane protein n=1 Tax=Cystobacterineae bacterium TaxID=1934914 RepID=A0A1P8VPY2_9BACT|nr:membrane protein [Cystobacterineae bacterium]